MTKYCISWTNSRGETHTGPALWTLPAHTDFLYNLDSESLDQIEKPRLKTYEEAQELADSMNSSPEFHNQSHQVVVYKGKNRPIGLRQQAQQSRTFTPVFLLPKKKVGRPRRVNA